MKKYLLIGGILFGSLSVGHAQVSIQYVNMSNKDIRISVPIYDIDGELLPAKGGGNMHGRACVRTNDEIIILQPAFDHVNSNRSAKDTTYTSGYWKVNLYYNENKKRWYSRLVKQKNP